MSNARRLLDELTRKLTAEDEEHRPIPVAAPPHDRRPLAIVMATFDDFDGVWFTIEAILLYHSEVAEQISCVVFDNHPEGPAAAALNYLESKVEFCRCVPFRGYRGTVARDLAIRAANADIIVCVDSHVMLAPGALTAVLEYFDQHPDSTDLVQGPPRRGRQEAGAQPLPGVAHSKRLHTVTFDAKAALSEQLTRC